MAGYSCDFSTNLAARLSTLEIFGGKRVPRC